MIPSCPTQLPDLLQAQARRLCEEWIASPLRPQPSKQVHVHWTALIRDWADASSLPLFMRKHRGDRGSEIPHASGRILVPVDNSAAHWSLAAALEGVQPALGDIEKALRNDEIPVALAFKAQERERARYRCMRHRVSLNALGWKICHIDDVGFGGRIDLAEAPIERLKDHFVRYMTPANMFVVPLVWSGLGEMPEMIEAARRALKAGRP